MSGTHLRLAKFYQVNTFFYYIRTIHSQIFLRITKLTMVFVAETLPARKVNLHPNEGQHLVYECHARCLTSVRLTLTNHLTSATFSWVAHLPYKKITNSNIRYPYHWVTKRAIWGHSDFSRLDVPNLHILRIGDIQGTSTNSVMSFHNLDQISGHWLSRDQQQWDRGVLFCRLAQPSLNATVLFPKGLSHLLCVCKSLNLVSACIPSPSFLQTLTNRGGSGHQTKKN